MKTSSKVLMLVAAAAMTFVSCQKGIEIQETESGAQMKTITISTGIATKTTLDSDHAALVWSTGDKVSLFNNADDTTNTKLTYAAGEKISVEVPAATTEVYLHYPYYNGNKDKTEASIYISANQTQENPGELDGYYFPMVAKGTVSEDNTADVEFYPVAGALALNIYNSELEGSETVNFVKVTPTANTGFIGSQKTDITKDNVVYSAPTGEQTYVMVTLTNGLALSASAPADKQKFAGQIYACLAKQKYNSVEFTISTDKGIYVIKSSSTSNYDLETYDFVSINIDLAKASFTSSEVNPGDYVVLALDSDKYYAMTTGANGTTQRRERQEFSYSGSGSVSTDDTSLIWTLAKSGSDFTFSAQGQYLNSGNNTAPLSSTAEAFSITAGTSTGAYIVTNDDSRFLKMNGEFGFGFYTSSGEVLLVPATYTGNPVLTMDTADLTLAADDTGSKTLATSGYLYTSISAAACADANGTSASDWMTASCTDGTITYKANSANTSTTTDRVAYIVVTASNANGSVKAAIKVTQVHVVGAAEDGDVLWAEPFNGFSSGDVPTASNSGTTVYGGGSVTYACVNGGSATKIFNEKLAGGTAPELLVSKSNGSFTASGIPTGSATTMTLSFKANNANLTVSSSTTGITLTKVTNYLYTITATSGVTSFDLMFKNAGSGNTRLDDISLIVGVPEKSITVTTADASDTATSAGTTATLNGTITLENGASISEVTEAGFYYKLSSASSFTKKTCASVSSTNISYNLTGLTAGSAYTYYAYAIYGGEEVVGAEKTFTPSVATAQSSMVFDLTKASYSSSSADKVVWSGDVATMTLQKASSSTNANNYLGGAGTNAHTRFYKDQTLTFTPASGKEIMSIVITFTSKSYADNFKASTWSNASVASSSSIVTVTPTNGSSAIMCTISAATRATKVEIFYK